MLNQYLQKYAKIGISFGLSLISILLAYLISIPIGIYSAYKKDSASDRGMSLILFILYSMPSFFVGTLLLLQFANPDNLKLVSQFQEYKTLLFLILNGDSSKN